jgi:hypothetical protein
MLRLDRLGYHTRSGLTCFQEVIRLLVPDGILAFCIRPPRRRLDVALGIRVVRLLLWFHEFDKGFAHHFAGRLLHVFEAHGVEAFHLRFIADDQLLGLLDRDRRIIIVSISSLVE